MPARKKVAAKRTHAKKPLPPLQFSYALPYGAVLHDKGVQFVVYSRSATAMRVLLYNSVDDQEPAEVIALDPALPALKAVGVQAFAAHLRGETRLETALAAAQQDTRRYAKRQMTWARGQTPDWPRLSGLDTGDHWRQFLALNRGLTR